VTKASKRSGKKEKGREKKRKKEEREEGREAKGIWVQVLRKEVAQISQHRDERKHVVT